MPDVNDWLSDWVEKHINSPLYMEHKSLMTDTVEMCVAHAASDGINEADLVEAADGDLAQYLLDRQNSLTDAEVRRQSEEND